MAATLVCPNCGFSENPATARFCGNCASRLPTVCSICGAMNPQGFRFCGQCAAPLEETRPLRSFHRVVTVLFVDICNSTVFTNRLGAERMYTLLDMCLRQLSKAIRRYEGTIDKVTGDGVMAVFGLPTTLEQHTLQAALAALALFEELAYFNAQAETDGVRFEIRVGVATGSTVSGGLGSDRSRDVTVVGEAVNLAARLQQVADQGAIVVNEALAQALAPSFELALLPPLTLKGFEVPVSAFQLLGRRAQPGRARGIGGALTPLVGRQGELAELAQAAEWLQAGQGGVVLLTGEAGIGKSRLTNEALDSLRQQGARVLEGDCFSHTRTVPYNAFLGVVRDFCAILPTDGRDIVRVKIREAVAGVLTKGNTDLVPYLEYLLSLDLVDEALLEQVRHMEPAQLKRQLFLALRDLFVAEARRQPLVLLLDDLQWADELSSELIPFLSQSFLKVPAVLHLVARTGYRAHQRLMFAEVLEVAEERCVRLDLLPLSDEHLYQMAQVLLPQGDQESFERLVGHAEGVPYYLEELVRHVLEAPGDPTLPTSLQTLIAARYDRLPEPLQTTLAKASVIGRRFAAPLLQALPGVEADGNLSSLHQRGFIRPRGANPDEWSFAHVLLQEAIYGSMMEQERRKVHGQVGETLERLAGDRLDEHVSTLAYHFARSEEGERATRYGLRAAAQAAGRFANEEALRLFDEVAARMGRYEDRSADQHLLLEGGRGDVLTLMGQYEEARSAFQRAIQVVQNQSLPDTTLHASLERRLATTYEKQSHYDEARAHLEAAQQLLGTDGDPAERARIHSDMGWIAFNVGEIAAAQALYLTALEEALRGGDPGLQGRIYNRLAGVYFRQGHLDQARQMLERSLTMSQRLNDQATAARVLNNLGSIAQVQANWAKAEQYHHQSEEVAARNGDVFLQVQAKLNAASATLMQGRFEEASHDLTLVHQLAQTISLQAYVGFARMHQGRIYFFQDQIPLARHAFIEAWCHLKEAHQFAECADVADWLGRVALKRDRPKLAQRLATLSLALADREHGVQEAFRSKRLLAAIALVMGQTDKAAALLNELQGMALDGAYEQAMLMLVQAEAALQQGHEAEHDHWTEQANVLFDQTHTPPVLRRFV